MGQREHASLARTLGIAGAITLAFAVVAGAINGWAVGAYEDFILEQHERAREASGVLKRYAWTRTMHFALPLALGGVAAWAVVRRATWLYGLPLLGVLALGAAAGWATAYMVGAMTADRWSEISTTLILPAVLFVAIPAIKILKDG